MSAIHDELMLSKCRLMTVAKEKQLYIVFSTKSSGSRRLSEKLRASRKKKRNNKFETSFDFYPIYAVN